MPVRRYKSHRLNVVSSFQRTAVIEAAGGRCFYCGATDVPLEVHFIRPVSAGGTAEVGNMQAVCPNCHRMLDMQPSELHFADFLLSLLKASNQFRAIRTEVPFGSERRLRADITAERVEDNQQLVIECKSLAVLSGQRLPQLIAQLERYHESLGTERLILAYPGKAGGQVVDELRSHDIEVWDLDRIGELFADQIEASDDPHYGPLFRRAGARSRRPGELDLFKQLKECPPGSAAWSRYQKLIGRILQLLFCPPLAAPLSESADRDKVNRRDFIFPNYVSDGFWLALRQRYGADYILIDAKNSKGNVSKAHVLQVSNYLKSHGVGLFGIIVGRLGPDRAAEITLREQWLLHSKLIVVLTDDDIENMLLARISEGDPATILGERIQQFRLKI